MAIVAIRPAVGEHFINPQFQKRGRAIPLHGMLPDDQIGTGKCLLLGGDIDIKIGIELIQGAYLYVIKRPYLLKHPLIRMRVLRIRMGVNYQNHQWACVDWLISLVGVSVDS